MVLVLQSKTTLLTKDKFFELQRKKKQLNDCIAEAERDGHAEEAKEYEEKLKAVCQELNSDL